MPSFIEATGDQVYMRFHDKNRDNWFKRKITAAERYRYWYSERELRTSREACTAWKNNASGAHNAIFNNCYQSFGIINATTMATILRGQRIRVWSSVGCLRGQLNRQEHNLSLHCRLSTNPVELASQNCSLKRDYAIVSFDWRH